MTGGENSSYGSPKMDFTKDSEIKKHRRTNPVLFVSDRVTTCKTG
jgi:hypothetical protein